MNFEEWKKFKAGKWQEEIDVRNFIQLNYTPYEGDSSFLVDATEKTQKLWEEVLELYKKERAAGGVIGISKDIASTISSHEAGFIDKNLEQIVGLQTEEPLKRAIMPNGGIRIVEKSCSAYDQKISDELSTIYHKYKRTHNDGVFRAYSDEMRKARKSHVITGLPDAYGRGRIIGDYRRVALYGVDRLIEEKTKDKKALNGSDFSVDMIRQSEELAQQINFLKKLKEMAIIYGFDIGEPAKNAKEAIQWTYFGYLAAIKENNGAAMSLGRVDAFFDIYFQRDFKRGELTEKEAQEIIDNFVKQVCMAL